MERDARTGSRAALAVALVLGLAALLVVVLRTPWDVLPVPPGGRTPPDPTAGLDPDEVALAEAFTGSLRPVALVSLLLGLAVSALLGLTRLGGRLVRTAGSLLGGGWLAQVLLGVPALIVTGRAATLPLSAYTETVRHRYGLSTRGWGLWWRDVAVSVAITAAVTTLLVLAFLWLVRRSPRMWWMWSGVAAVGMVVVGSFLYPVVIEPAFNRFEPLAAGELRTDVLALAEDNGTPVRDVLVSDASRRTTALNAYVSGFGSTRRVVLYDTVLYDTVLEDTVLERLPDAHIEAIVAHELAHVAAQDVLTGTLTGALGAGAATALAGWLLCRAPLLRRAGADSPGDPRVVPLLLLLVMLGGLLGTPVHNAVSRQVEARADVRALELTGDAEAFIDMQRRLATANLGDPDPPDLWQWYFGSHPTVAERVALARDWQRLGGQR